MPRRHLSVVWALLLASLLWVAGCAPQAPGSGSGPSPAVDDEQWQAVVGDSGMPRIHQRHIFFGEINLHGDAVGFHYRATGEQARSARLVPGTQTPADRHGVYQAKVELFDPQSGRWVAKNAMSSFYPDSWSPEKVLSEIRSAYAHRRDPDHPSDRFEGVSDSGVRISGYLATDNSIVTAFPLRDRR